MLAVRTIARKTLSLEDIPEPELKPGRALIDLHIFDADYPIELPIIQSHEMARFVIAALLLMLDVLERIDDHVSNGSYE